MDRLLSLRNSVLSNTSVNSELGYETAQDDSISSLYYSINDDTISNIDVASPTSPGHTVVSSETNLNSESSISTLGGTHSSIETLIAEPIETDQPIILSSSDDVAENGFETGPIISSFDGEIVNHEVDTIGMESLATAPNLIFNLPPEPALSLSNITNFAGSASIMQELYVVTAAQQRRTRAPELTEAARRTTVRFQDSEMPGRNEIPRRNEMARRSEMTRKSEMPRRTILALSRQTQVDSNTEARQVSRRTLVDRNIEMRPEPSRKDIHVCDICKKSFPLRSTLIVHKTSHKTDCQYCDKTFKKALALSIHLKENCQKIPSAVRRKILTKEFKNVTSKV